MATQAWLCLAWLAWPRPGSRAQRVLGPTRGSAGGASSFSWRSKGAGGSGAPVGTQVPRECGACGSFCFVLQLAPKQHQNHWDPRDVLLWFEIGLWYKSIPWALWRPWVPRGIPGEHGVPWGPMDPMGPQGAPWGAHGAPIGPAGRPAGDQPATSRRPAGDHGQSASKQY